MQGIHPRSQPGVVAVHGQGVLGQVVGADGEEIGMFGQALGEQRRGGHLDHHPQLGALPDAQLAGQPVQALADGDQLVDFGHHRQHDPATLLRADLQQRAQLLVEQFRAHLAQADAAQAQHRVGLGRQGQVVELLVAAHIDGTDDHRAFGHGIEHGLVGAALLGLVRRGGAVDEQELAAQQADAVGTLGQGLGGFLGTGDVGGNLDHLAIAGAGALLGGGPLALAGFVALLHMTLHLGQALRISLGFQAALVGVQHQRRAGGQLQQRFAHGHQARQAAGAGKDGDVRGGAAGGHAQPGDLVAGQ